MPWAFGMQAVRRVLGLRPLRTGTAGTRNQAYSTETWDLATEMSKMAGRKSAPKVAAVPKKAATVVVCRPKEGTHKEDYEVLFVRRKETARFMPGFYVFPGGIVEEADTLAADHTLLEAAPEAMRGSEEATMRMAAIRETFEESNVLLCKPEVPLDTLAHWRPSILADCNKFVEMCESVGCKPDFTGLYSWARWVTPEEERYRYDTYFYLIPLSATQRDHAMIDDLEVTKHVWLSPGEALSKYAEGEVKLAPPTWVMVSELATMPKLNHLEAAGDAGRDMRPIIPRFRLPQKDGEEVAIALPGDAESHHPMGAATRRRIVLPRGQPFRFEQSADIESDMWDARPKSRSNL